MAVVVIWERDGRETRELERSAAAVTGVEVEVWGCSSSISSSSSSSCSSSSSSRMLCGAVEGGAWSFGDDVF